MSSPVRAVARQWTFRRSSPWRYSRMLTSSSPWTAMVRREPSPPPPWPPAGPPAPSGRTRGTTSSDGAVGADGAALDEAEGVHQAQPQRAEDVPAAPAAVHAVAAASPSRRCRQPVDDEPRRAAELGGQRLGQPPEAARRGRRRW